VLFARGPRSPPAGSVRVALALLIASCSIAALGACAGSGASRAQSLLRQTFESHKPIESGRVSLSVALSRVGSADARAPGTLFSLRLRGPFQSLGSARLPRFALLIGLTSSEPGAVGLDTARHTLAIGATSIGGQLFIALDGKQFLAPATTLQSLERGFAQALRARPAAGRSSTFAALGVDPREWLSSPTIAGSATIAGEETVHIVAGLNVARFVADLDTLSGDAGTVGGEAGEVSRLLSRARISALSRSVHSARVDIYTGARDHLLRRLSLNASISTTAQTLPVLGGTRSARLTLVLQFAHLNQPQSIVAPRHALPISQLGPALERPTLPGRSGRGG
jgi:hypothetical protein